MDDTHQAIIDKAIILIAYERVVAEVFAEAAAWRHTNPGRSNHSLDEVREAAIAFDELTRVAAINRFTKIRDEMAEALAPEPDAGDGEDGGGE